jgi:hypothetical protein
MCLKNVPCASQWEIGRSRRLGDRPRRVARDNDGMNVVDARHWDGCVLCEPTPFDGVQGEID